MTAYYNEIDAYAAQWLRNLIAAGHIAAGDVDERSIVDVRADDLKGYTQCHFFAGIGGWSLALRLAGWPDTRPVWTGSCPCQPFSPAGQRKGSADERHLWPRWFDLIRQSRPAIVFGEQVDRAIGKTWLDAVAHDLEAEDYAFGSSVLPACAVGAPHRRNRIWFVAHAGGAELRDKSGRGRRTNGQGPAVARAHGSARYVADADRGRRSPRNGDVPSAGYRGATTTGGCDVAVTEHGGCQGRDTEADRLASSALPSGWWITEPDVGRVAHGVSARVDKLRAYGNAIVPQVAAEFIAAARECLMDQQGRTP